jgi:hypothetical protein
VHVPPAFSSFHWIRSLYLPPQEIADRSAPLDLVVQPVQLFPPSDDVRVDIVGVPPYIANETAPHCATSHGCIGGDIIEPPAATSRSVPFRVTPVVVNADRLYGEHSK